VPPGGASTSFDQMNYTCDIDRLAVGASAGVLEQVRAPTHASTKAGDHLQRAKGHTETSRRRAPLAENDRFGRKCSSSSDRPR